MNRHNIRAGDDDHGKLLWQLQLMLGALTLMW